MRLYHGTTLEVREPKIIVHEIGCDFGFGFYTTDIREQAERWAVRRAKVAARKKLTFLSVYEAEAGTCTRR